MKNLNKFLLLIIVIQFTVIMFYFFKIENLKDILGIDSRKFGIVNSKSKSIANSIKQIIGTQEKLSRFENYLGKISAKSKVDIQPVDTIQARNYHTYYRTNAMATDSTRAILFEWPKIIQALDSAYNIDTSDWIDPAFWADKGFFIYLTKYNVNGTSPVTKKDQTTALFQLAILDSATVADTTDWNVLPNTIFNFGDLRPPKKINNEEIIVRKIPQ